MSLKFQDPMTSYRLIQLPVNMQSGGLQHSLGCLAHTSTSKCFVVVIDSDFELSRWLVEADELAEARSISIIIDFGLNHKSLSETLQSLLAYFGRLVKLVNLNIKIINS